MRICVVYDCLYPYTVGGAERFYRSLAEGLAAGGHELTYVTLRQWPGGEAPELDGVRVVEAGPRMRLYHDGRRRILPPLRFGLGVLRHLARHGRDYDVVLTGSFPYFPLLAAAALRRRYRYELAVDWPEVWTRDYWSEYLGGLGAVGWWVQRRCIRVRQRAICPSQLTAGRLRENAVNGDVTVYRGLLAPEREPASPLPAEPVVVFAGRHIPEKRVTVLPPALARARETIPGLRAEIFGDGPDRARLLEEIERANLTDAIEAPGFVDQSRVEEALARALCLVLPSSREGYGLIVAEAAARGVPSVVVAGPDNAATELVDEGVNGFVAPTGSPDDLARAIVQVHDGGAALRASTARWFAAHAEELSLAASIEIVSALLPNR